MCFRVLPDTAHRHEPADRLAFIARLDVGPVHAVVKIRQVGDRRAGVQVADGIVGRRGVVREFTLLRDRAGAVLKVQLARRDLVHHVVLADIARAGTAARTVRHQQPVAVPARNVNRFIRDDLRPAVRTSPVVVAGAGVDREGLAAFKRLVLEFEGRVLRESIHARGRGNGKQKHAQEQGGKNDSLLHDDFLPK